jgi:hypothetical protein
MILLCSFTRPIRYAVFLQWRKISCAPVVAALMQADREKPHAWRGEWDRRGGDDDDDDDEDDDSWRKRTSVSIFDVR